MTRKPLVQEGRRRSKHCARTALEMPRDEFARLGASMSEPYLPSTASYEVTDMSTRTSFTALPDAFFRRRAGTAMRARSMTRSASFIDIAESIRPDASYEVEHLGKVKAVDSGWLDDDVEEVMVVSKNDKRRRPLSVIVEASEGHIRRTFKREQPILGDRVSVDANHFEYIRNLHRADACESILARHSDSGRVYTVKLVRRSGHDAHRCLERIRNEQAVLKTLTSHGVPYLVRLWWSFEDERAMYIVTDRTDGRKLNQLIAEGKPLSGREALICAAELVTGICGLHRLEITLLRVHPSSIFVDQDGHIVISDLETACVVHGENGSNATPPFNLEEMAHYAPELVLGWEYDHSVDWWCFGLLLFWVYMGSHPFIDDADVVHESIVRSKLLYGKIRDNRFEMDEDAYNLVVRCLQRNPALRIDDQGVQMHEYFREITWDDVAKRSEAPFHPLACDTRRHTAEILSPHQHVSEGPVQPFPFDWQRDLPPRNALDSLESQMRNDIGIDEAQEPGDETVLPARDTSRVPAEACTPRLKSTTQKISDPLPAGHLHDPVVSILPEPVMTPIAGLPTPPNSRIGNLRKYSSLNFDDIDSLESASSSNHIGDAQSAAEQLPCTQATAPLRKSKSILGISLESLRDKAVDDASASGSARWKGKLLKRSRPETPVPLTPSVPPVELPRGVQKIGEGIGYTYRGGMRRPSLNLASLTPRTCHGILTGRRSKSVGKEKNKDESQPEQDMDLQVPLRATGGGEAENEEDIMDEVMREIYGDEWNVSPEQRGARYGGASAGLGWTDALTMTRFGMAEDVSFGGPDCTLRLVTSPSTPKLDP